MLLGPVARGLLTLYSTTVLMSFGHGMVLPIIPVIADEFEVSGGLAAQVVTAFAAGRFIGQPLGGILIDRFGTRAAVTLGPLVIAVSVFGAAVTAWFWPLLLALFVAGAADSTWMLGREVAGVDLVRADQRGRLMSGFMGFHSVGMGFGGLASGFLGELTDVQTVFYTYTALVVAAFLLGLIAPSARVHAGAVVDGRAPEGSWLSRMRGLFLQIRPELRATYAVLVFATACMMLYRMAYQSMLPLYADEIGLSASRIGVLFFVMTIGSLVMIVPAGFVVDKIGRKWATVPSTAIPGIGFLLIPLMGSFGPLAAIAVLMGFSNGLSLGSVATSTYDVVPESARARLQAARRTVAEVGAITAPLLGGFLAVGFGPGVAFTVYAPMLLIAAALLLFVARETLVRRPPDPAVDTAHAHSDTPATQ